MHPRTVHAPRPRVVFALLAVAALTAGAWVPLVHANPVQTYRVDIVAPPEVPVGVPFAVSGKVSVGGGVPSPVRVHPLWLLPEPVVELYLDGLKVDSVRTDARGYYAFTVQHDVQERVTLQTLVRDSVGLPSWSARLHVDVVTLPGAPGPVSSERGPLMDDVDLTWEAPASAGGSRSLEYRVYEVLPNGNVTQLAAVRETAYRLREVELDTERSFFVAAANAAGEGPAGPVSNHTMPSAFPADELIADITRVAMCDPGDIPEEGDWDSCDTVREGEAGRNDGRNGARHDYYVWVDVTLRHEGEPVRGARVKAGLDTWKVTGEFRHAMIDYEIVETYTASDGSATVRFGPFDGRIYRTTGCDRFVADGMGNYQWAGLSDYDSFKWRLCAVR